MQLLENGVGQPVPCEGCGPPTNTSNGSGAFGYALEYRCDQIFSVLVVKLGVNKNTTEPVLFNVYADGVKQGGTVELDSREDTRPEQFATMQVNHVSGVAQTIKVTGVGKVTGKVYVSYKKVITCNCPAQTTTTTSPSSTSAATTTTSSTVPSTVSSTSPGTSTVSSSPGSSVQASTTVAFQLPATGGSNAGTSVDAGIGLLLAATVLIGLSKMRKKNHITR